MTVGEEGQGNEAAMDKFPVGMRVLAVDDDPVCLKLLESLLRHCKYHATTAAHAETALKMLREGKDQFDLVISDVHMPDMDGFKLLELIGLEMDVPVIMLSANGETETVMKGITHGACDYLVKPVRVKELKNIWQHVVRRKPDLRNRSSGGNGDAEQKVQSGDAEPEGEQGGAKRTRKYSRKKRNDVDDSADSKENTDLSAEKKPRVTWTSQLHRKFVEVVNQIGIERAVPKKILDMMGVDYITRENVASHLQKYRLYLKRVSKYTSRRSNLFVDASERWNSVYNKNELDSIKDYREHERRQAFPADASSNSSNLFGRMNSASALGARGLLTTRSIQLSNAQSNLGIGRVGHGGSLLRDAVPKSLQGLLNGGLSNARNCFSSGNSFANSLNGGPSDARKCFPSGPSGNSFANISNGTMLDASKCFPSYRSGNSYASILRGNLLDSSKGIPSCLSGNSFADISNGGILAPANQFPVQSPEFSNHRSVRMNSSSTGLFGPLVCDASQFPDPGNCINSWQTVVPSKFSDLRKDGTSLGPSQANTPKINQLSSFAASSDQIPMFGNELQNQMAAIMNTTTSMAGLNEQMAPFNIGGNTSSKEMLNDNFAFGSASSISSALHNLQMGSFVMPAQMLNGGDAGGILPVQDGTADQQAVDDQLDYSNDFLMGTNGPNGSGDLDDIVAGLLNQDFIENEDAFMDGDWELVP